MALTNFLVNVTVPSNKPGTSPFASNVFIRSKNPDSSTLDSSKINAIFSFLQPDRRKTARKSSSKSSLVYLLCTCVGEKQIYHFPLSDPSHVQFQPARGHTEFSNSSGHTSVCQTDFFLNPSGHNTVCQTSFFLYFRRGRQ